MYNKLINIKILFALFLLIGWIGISAQEANASHLRGVTMSWAPTGSPGEVEFRFLYSEAGIRTVGSSYSVGINFGNGISGTATGTVTSVNANDNYFVADLKVRHTYTGAGPYTAFYNVCCRISTLQNGRDGTIRMETTVTPFSGNKSPVVSLPTVVTVPVASFVQFNIPASDADGDNIRYRLATNLENGNIAQPSNLSVNPNTGQITWNTAGLNPAAGHLYTAQIIVEDLDTNGNIKSKVPVDFIMKFVAVVGSLPTLTINPEGPLTVSANTPVTFDVTGNDVDANSRVTLNAAGLPAGAVMSPALGAQVSPPVTSTFNWTPTLAQAGPTGNTYVINFTATDDTNQQALKSITINVLPVGAPTANSQSIPAQAGVAQNVVLQATDPNGLDLTFSVSGSPSHGTAVLSGSPTCLISGGVSTCTQNVTYTATAGYSGPDVFTFRANNGVSNSNAANVSITVASNRAPVANDDSFSTDEDTALTNANVLINDSDSDGDLLTPALINPPANAANFTLNPNGSFFYMPNPNFNGSDSFTYKVSDGNLDSNTATVTITVDSVNDNPTTNNDSATIAEDSGANQVDVLTNDSILPDVNETLTVTNVTQGGNGTVAITNGGANVSYTPNANYFGADSFTYTISDGNGGSASATVNVNVTNVNDNPTAGNDSSTVAEDSGANQINVLTNDSILPDTGETLTVTGITQGANGSVTITNGGADVSYTPAANFFGADSFTYTVSDGNGGSATATVNVTVTGVNDAPVADNDTAQVDEDNTLNVVAPGVTGNDSDIENSPLTAALVTGPSNAASFTFNPDGSYNYTPNPNFNGSDSFTYKVSDGELESNTATVSITVNAVNDAPTAVNDSYGVNEDTALNTPAPGVTGNDSDVENSSLSAILVSGPSNAASFTLNADGSFSYTPASNFNGSDSFTYKASDSDLESNTATVSITVNAVNDAPTVSGATVTRQQGTPGTVSTIAAVADVDNSAGSLTFSVTSLPTGITVTDIANNNGTINATVTAGCNAAVGANTVSLKVTDGEGAMGTGALTINVTKETTPPVTNPISNVAASLPPNSNATSTAVNFPLSTASDNCGAPVTVITNPVSGSVFDVGTTTVNVTATDQAGNQSTASFTVTVQYSFSMFYYSGLLLNQQALNQVTAGSNVSVRFTLSDYKGDPYRSPPTSQQISCSTYAPIGAAAVINRFAPDPYYSSLYDFYQTTWQTQTGWKFTCRRLSLHMNDGTTKTLDFYFK